MGIASAIDRFEKSHYPFRRYPKAQCETVLFPGCAFPSQFPQAMDRLADICSENGVGIAYDCCGVSLVGHGDGSAARRVLASIRKRLRACGCKRLVCMCPNCYYYLRDNLDVELLTAYQLLEELGVRPQGDFQGGVLFVPCPDRKERVLEEGIRGYCGLQGADVLAKGCCGLRPDIAAKGAEVSGKCANAVMAGAGERTLYTCCASCSGQFKRMGCEGVRHVLPAMLGIDEEPDAAHAIANRAKRRFDKRTDPAC